MKKTLKITMVMMLVLAFVFSTVACGAGTKTVTGAVNNHNNQGDQNTPTPDPAKPTPTTDPAATPTPVVAKVNGYPFVYKGVNICIDDNSAETILAIGNPMSTFEAASCAFDGKSYTYSYNGFQFETYEKDGKHLIFAITILDDMTATPEGIKLGATKDQVIKAYGNGGEITDKTMIFKKDNMNIMFILKDDKVASIQYSLTL